MIKGRSSSSCHIFRCQTRATFTNNPLLSIFASFVHVSRMFRVNMMPVSRTKPYNALADEALGVLRNATVPIFLAKVYLGSLIL